MVNRQSVHYARTKLPHTLLWWSKKGVLLINPVKYPKQNLQCRIKGLCQVFDTIVQKKQPACSQLIDKAFFVIETFWYAEFAPRGHIHRLKVCGLLINSDSFIWDCRSVVCWWLAQKMIVSSKCSVWLE